MKKLIVAAAVLIFTLIGLTSCSSAKDEPIKLGEYSSYTIVSETALRSCTDDDISEIIGFFDGMEYEKTDMPDGLTADTVGMFAYSDDNVISGIGFGSSGDERYFSYTPNMAVTEIGAGADFFGENARVYRISAIDHDEVVDLLYELAYTAFTGTITRVGADGLYYIAEPDEGEFPQGAVEVYSDERLNFGDRVRVTFYGGVMESYPQQIRQVEIVKIEDGNSPYTGWETVSVGAYKIPDMSHASDLEPELFRSRCMEEVDFESETKAGRKFTLVGFRVFADTEKNPDAVYAYNMSVELDYGGYIAREPAFAESVNSGQAPWELDMNRLDDYLTVYDMDGYPLAVFTYGNEMTFYTSAPSEDGIHSEGDIAFFDNPLSEIGEDSAVSVRYSGTGLEADPENRTVTDIGAGIRYRFDFENRTVSAEALADSSEEAVRQYLMNHAKEDFVESLEIKDISVSEEESGLMRTRYLDSDLAVQNGWTNDFTDSFTAVIASYSVDYDNTKTFLDEGGIRMRFVTGELDGKYFLIPGLSGAVGTTS